MQAVDKVSFQVRHADMYALLRPNGPGKTTIVEIPEGTPGCSRHRAGLPLRTWTAAAARRLASIDLNGRMVRAQAAGTLREAVEHMTDRLKSLAEPADWS
jgi:ABC-type hemin transport system ATPase subunit